jgi:hypothetical protein
MENSNELKTKINFIQKMPNEVIEEDLGNEKVKEKLLSYIH